MPWTAKGDPLRTGVVLGRLQAAIDEDDGGGGGGRGRRPWESQLLLRRLLVLLLLCRSYVLDLAPPREGRDTCPMLAAN